MKDHERRRPKQAAWRKSSFCMSGECAELAHEDGMILLRSSLARRKVVAYTQEEFRALRLGIQAGEFDDLA